MEARDQLGNVLRLRVLVTREEIEFRERLRALLMGAWIPTWHEPTIGSSVGVPDCSFVMKKGNCETGWAELKVARSVRGGKLVVHIEPSQHQWMYNHANLVPCVFLIEIPEIHTRDGQSTERKIYMVDGKYSQIIATDNFSWPSMAINKDNPYKYAICRDRLIADLRKITKRHL